MFKKINFLPLICFISISLSYAAASKVEISKILSRIRQALKTLNLEIIAHQEGYTQLPRTEKIIRVAPKLVRFVSDSKGRWRYESEDFQSIYDGKYWWKLEKSKCVFSKQIVSPERANFTRQTYLKGILSAYLIPIFTYDEKDPKQKAFWDFGNATLQETTIGRKKSLLLTIPSFKEAFKLFSSETKRLISTSTFVFKIWIDPKTYLPLQIQTDEKQNKSENPEWQGAVTKWFCKIVKFSLNPHIKKDTFKFSPPKGAREINPSEIGLP